MQAGLNAGMVECRKLECRQGIMQAGLISGRVECRQGIMQTGLNAGKK